MSTTTLSSFCQGAEQVLAVEAAVRNEHLDEDLLKKIALWRMGLFRIVVMGEIKKGKSSFINALLGVENLVPVCDNVATSTVYKVCYGQKLGYRVFFTKESAKPVLTISADQVADYGTEDGNPGNEKCVEFIQVLYPSPLLKDGLVIIDTPGLGGIVKGHKEITYNYVPKSDAVFVVTESGNAPLGKLEMSLIEDLKKVTKHIYFVQTKSNLVTSSDESEKRRERNLQILSEQMDFRRDEIKYFIVDSRLKQFADKNKNREMLEASGFDKVAAFVNRYIRPNVQRLILERATAVLKPRVEMLGQVMADREKVLNATTQEDRDRLQEQIKSAQDQVEAWERDELPRLQDAFEQGLLEVQHKAISLLDQCVPHGSFYDDLVRTVNGANSVDEVKQIAEGCNEKLPEFFTRIGNEVATEVASGVAEKVSVFLQGGANKKDPGMDLMGKESNFQFITTGSVGGGLERFETKGFFEFGRNAVYGGFAGAAIAGAVGGAVGSVVPVVGTIIGSEIGVAIASLWGATQSVRITNARNLDGAKAAVINSIGAWMSANHRNYSSQFSSMFSTLRLKAASSIRAAIRDTRKGMKHDLDLLAKDGKTHLEELGSEQAEFNAHKGRYLKALMLMGVLKNNTQNVAQ